MRQSSVNALCAASCGSPVCAQDRTMLQRVVRNRFEFSVSLPAGSVFKGEHDGIFVASEQAQTLQAPAERASHSASILSLRDLLVEVPEKLIKIGICRLERNSPRCQDSKKN